MTTGPLKHIAQTVLAYFDIISVEKLFVSNLSPDVWLLNGELNQIMFLLRLFFASLSFCLGPLLQMVAIVLWPSFLWCLCHGFLY